MSKSTLSDQGSFDTGPSKKDSSNKGTAGNVFSTFLKLGVTSFGGPVAHIGYFRKELVEKQRWVTEDQFSQLLAVCQFLPGPASSQLGFALGLLRAGWAGALLAFFAFTLPSALLLIGFASALGYLSGEIGQAAIHGLKLVACAVVADAVLGMAKKLCPNTPRRSIAVLGMVVLLSIEMAWSQIIVIIGGALMGLLLCRNISVQSTQALQVPYDRKMGLIFFILFLLLFFALLLFSNGDNLYAIANAFYQAGAMVFGGGHVVLPLLENSMVTSGWVSKENFLAGYGAAQAIPGPMFAFSAYLGAIIPSAYSSTLIAFLALVFMFLPGFLLLAAALPLWQSISHNPQAASAIAGVNAAVVGLLAAALYDPIITSGIQSWVDTVIVLFTFALLTIWKRSPLWAVVGCVTASVALTWV